MIDFVAVPQQFLPSCSWSQTLVDFDLNAAHEDHHAVGLQLDWNTTVKRRRPGLVLHEPSIDRQALGSAPSVLSCGRSGLHTGKPTSKNMLISWIRPLSRGWDSTVPNRLLEGRRLSWMMPFGRCEPISFDFDGVFVVAHKLTSGSSWPVFSVAGTNATVYGVHWCMALHCLWLYNPDMYPPFGRSPLEYVQALEKAASSMQETGPGHGSADLPSLSAASDILHTLSPFVGSSNAKRRGPRPLPLVRDEHGQVCSSPQAALDRGSTFSVPWKGAAALMQWSRGLFGFPTSSPTLPPLWWCLLQMYLQLTELEAAFRRVKKGKASGPDHFALWTISCISTRHGEAMLHHFGSQGSLARSGVSAP